MDKRRGSKNVKTLEIYSQMANNEKNYTAQELKGDPSDEIWSGERKKSGQLETTKSQGLCRSFSVRSKFKFGSFSLTYNRVALDMFLNFPLPRFSYIYIYNGVIELPIKGCLCN